MTWCARNRRASRDPRARAPTCPRPPRPPCPTLTRRRRHPPQPENLFFAKGQKQLGFRYQFYPREELEDQLIEPPQDVKIDGIPLTVWDNSDADALPPW